MFSPDRINNAADISTKLNLTNESLTSPTTSLGGSSYLLTLGDAPLGATYSAASMSSVPIIGTALDDILTSEGSGDDSLIGLDGHDTLRSLGGVDFLFGSAGDDLLDAGDFADWLYGDAGNDTLITGTWVDPENVPEIQGFDARFDSLVIYYKAGDGGALEVSIDDNEAIRLQTIKFNGVSVATVDYGEGSRVARASIQLVASNDFV